MGQAFDVADVGAALAGSAVAAGADGMARSVGRIVVVSSAPDLRAAREDDLVITTTGTLASADETGRLIVTRLDEVGIAGLAIQLDRLSPLEAELLAAAEEASIPVVTFSDPLELNEAARIVLDVKSRRLQRMIDVRDRFARVTLDGGTASDIVAALHDLIGQPVALLGSGDRATTVAPPTARSLFDDPTSVVRMPIRRSGRDDGEIQVFTEGTTLGPDQLLAIEIASSEIAVRQAHLEAVVHEHADFEAITLERLVAGDLDGVEHVVERGRAFGWDLTLPRAVLLASIDPPVGEVDLPGVLRAIAAAARATLGPDSIVWTRSATVAVLLAPAAQDAADRRRLADGLRKELDRHVRTVTISIGVGRQVDEIISLPDSFHEARRAVDVGRWAKGRHVTEVFDELGLERLFASTPEMELADFVRSAIGPLLDHDRANNGELVATLETWLQTRNMAEAARRMPVHYNTLKNRLDRIEGILGPVIADPVRSLECEVALYVARHYDGPWKHPPEATSAEPAI